MKIWRCTRSALRLSFLAACSSCEYHRVFGLKDESSNFNLYRCMFVYCWSDTIIVITIHTRSSRGISSEWNVIVDSTSLVANSSSSIAQNFLYDTLVYNNSNMYMQKQLKKTLGSQQMYLLILQLSESNEWQLKLIVLPIV